MTKFNVGDKVIFNKENAHVAKQFDYEINKPYEVQEVFSLHCTIQIINEKGSSHSFDEERFELVESKPTKNQRITALENEVAELKLIVHELRGKKSIEPSTTNTVEDIIEFEGKQYRKVDREACEGDVVAFDKSVKFHGTEIVTKGKLYKAKKGTLGELAFVDNEGDSANVYDGGITKFTPENVAVYELIEGGMNPQIPIVDETIEPLTQNQQRAAIIEKAKKFVDENGGDDYHFEVDENERTVFAWKLVRNGQGYKAQHGIATCNPSDVYNEYLGRAISFGRAEDLDVSEFEQAVQPNEVVVGMVVETFINIEEHHKTIKVEKVVKDSYGIKLYENLQTAFFTPFEVECGDKIINDTNAKYEVSSNE